MKNLLLFTLALLATAVPAREIPVDDLAGWTSLAYRKIPPNRVSVKEGVLHIAVDRSSSPLVHKLDTPLPVTGFTLRARWAGSLNIPAGAVQGDRGSDDFVLKLGLVEAGDTTLGWFQRRVAADWILELYALAPEGTGIKWVDFYSTTQQQALVGSSRFHPLNKLLHENRVLYLGGPGSFELSHTFAEPVTALGLWISSDGDDTGSRFDLYVENIVLHTE